MEFKEIIGKNEQELKDMLKTNSEKFRDLRFKVSTNQTKSVRELRGVRKAIAKILTRLNQISKNDKK